MVNSIEERGRVKGLRDTVRKLVQKKFGLLSQQIVEQIDALSVERLDEILLAILDAKSIDELGLTA